jgi:hypothetical protein
MNKALLAIAAARASIKGGVKKNAKNEYSDYLYFSPEYISKIVDAACAENNIICTFSLMQDELGYFGETTVTELESGDSVTFKNRTSVPVIKATNSTQQYGGMLTYTKRYALMNIFNIEDDSADPDATNNTPKQTPAPANITPPPYGAPSQKKEIELPWLDQFDKTGAMTKNWTNVIAALKSTKYTVADIEKRYRLSKGVRTILDAEAFMANAEKNKK